MNTTRLSAMLILLLLAGLVVATGAAGDEPEEVRIYPSMDGFTYDILPGQVGVLRVGWAACSQGLVGVWIAASNYEVTLFDAETQDEIEHLTPEDVDVLWGPIELMSEPMEACVGQSRNAYSLWHYPLDELGPGEYTLASSMWIDHTLIDGGDYDEDGRPDLFRPEEYYFDTVNTIIVHSDG